MNGISLPWGSLRVVNKQYMPWHGLKYESTHLTCSLVIVDIDPTSVYGGDVLSTKSLFISERSVSRGAALCNLAACQVIDPPLI